MRKHFSNLFIETHIVIEKKKHAVLWTERENLKSQLLRSLFQVHI